MIFFSQQSILSTMWICVAVFLLWTGSGGSTEWADKSNLIQYSPADFYQKLNAGKIMFVFFERQGRLQKLACKRTKELRLKTFVHLFSVSPTISLFLAELEKSADVLQDYGILVGKVSVLLSMLRLFVIR